MNKKMNNKGFSLVELIIVIAIMAILIGVLAPAYLKYVEKSRKSTDSDAVAAAMNAIETVVLDPEYESVIKGLTDDSGKVTPIQVELKSNADGEITVKPDTLKDALKDIIGKYSIKSTDWKGGIIISGTVESNGHVRFELTHIKLDSTATSITTFSNSLMSRIGEAAGEANSGLQDSK